MKKVLGYSLLLVFVLSSTFLINGCATIFGWSAPEVVNIRSTPDQANITISDESGTKIFEGKTPTNVSLKKRKGYFSGKTYSVKITKDGFSDKTIILNTQTNGWYIGGNLVFGGLIGWLIVDPLSGAMWTFDTNDIDVTLDTSKLGMLSNSGDTRVILLKDVPVSLRSRMIKITK